MFCVSSSVLASPPKPPANPHLHPTCLTTPVDREHFFPKESSQSCCLEYMPISEPIMVPRYRARFAQLDSDHMPPQPLLYPQQKERGSSTDPTQSLCGLCSSLSCIIFTHQPFFAHAASFICDALSHKLLFILLNPAQISPSLRSLLSHLKAIWEFVPMLEPLSNCLLLT